MSDKSMLHADDRPCVSARRGWEEGWLHFHGVPTCWIRDTPITPVSCHPSGVSGKPWEGAIGIGSRISWSSEQAVLAGKPHTPCGHHVHLSLLLRSSAAFANHKVF